MKSMLFKTLVLVVLAYSSYTGNQGILNIVVGIIWILMCLSLVCFSIVWYGLEHYQTLTSQQIENFKTIVGEKPKLLAKILSISVSILTAIELAYSSYIVTSVIYFIVLISTSILFAASRNKIKE